MSDSHRSHLHTATAVTRIEHRQQLVRYVFGMAVQPATEDMFLTLAASSGATENAWLSDTGPCEGTERMKMGTFGAGPFTGPCDAHADGVEYA